MSGRMRTLISGFVAMFCFLVSLGATTGTVSAACKKADIEGVYDLYLFFGNEFAPGEIEVGTTGCELRVNRRGRVRARTECNGNGTRFGSESFRVGGGRLAVDRSCRVTGNFTSDDDCEFDFENARMARDKHTISGIGQDCEGIFWMLSAVKR